MSGKRNRQAGHNWERKCISFLSPIFPHLVTARAESRNADNLKLDLIYPADKYNELPINIQCKTMSKRVNYVKLLESMPEDKPNVILHRYTEKSEKGRFMEKGKYAIVDLDFMVYLLEQVYKQEKVKKEDKNGIRIERKDETGTSGN